MGFFFITLQLHIPCSREFLFVVMVRTFLTLATLCSIGSSKSFTIRLFDSCSGHGKLVPITRALCVGEKLTASLFLNLQFKILNFQKQLKTELFINCTIKNRHTFLSLFGSHLAWIERFHKQKKKAPLCCISLLIASILPSDIPRRHYLLQLSFQSSKTIG